MRYSMVCIEVGWMVGGRRIDRQGVMQVDLG